MEEQIIVKSEVIDVEYGGRTYVYNVYNVHAEMKIGDAHDFKPETDSLLEQTALRVTACIPFGSKKMLKFKDDPEREWHEQYIVLVLYEEVAPGHARVILKQPYLD